MEAANMFFHNKENQNNIQIRFTRDSVSMGDDCMAPHESKMLFGEADTFMDLLAFLTNWSVSNIGTFKSSFLMSNVSA